MKNIKKFENFESEDMGQDGGKKPSNYMFFENLEQIHWQTKKLLESDVETIDDLLNNGHDWATDHLSSAKEDIDQVFHFLMKRLDRDEEESLVGEGLETKEELVELLSKEQDIYTKEELETMNLDQLKTLEYDLAVNADENEDVNEKSKYWIKGAIKKKGSLRRKLGKKKGEKITAADIDSELQALKAKDKDPDKPGVQLSARDRSKYRQLNLAKTLRGLKK